MRWAASIGVLAGLLSGCQGSQEEEPAGPSIVLGVGPTTEQRVLAALTVVALDRAGITAEVRADLGDTVAMRREALRGAIDLYWDYTGAAWALGLGQEFPAADPQESYERVAQADLEQGLDWLTPTSANATLSLFVRSQDLPPEGERRGMEWLATVLSSGETLCTDQDFAQREGGLATLAFEYSINLNAVSLVFAGEDDAVRRAQAGECFAALATATSGPARNAGLERIVYDAPQGGYPPAFVVAPVVRGEVQQEIDLETALAPVVERLDTDTLGTLNAVVDRGAEPGQVAEQFLADLPPTAEPSGD